jgi:acyl carrier protein
MTWTRATVRDELIKVFVQHGQAGTPVNESSHLVADLGIDSLGVMEILEVIEDKFSLKIPDEALREVETVADVAAQIESRLKADGRLEE